MSGYIFLRVWCEHLHTIRQKTARDTHTHVHNHAHTHVHTLARTHLNTSKARPVCGRIKGFGHQVIGLALWVTACHWELWAYWDYLACSRAGNLWIFRQYISFFPWPVSQIRKQSMFEALGVSSLETRSSAVRVSLALEVYRLLGVWAPLQEWAHMDGKVADDGGGGSQKLLEEVRALVETLNKVRGTDFISNLF